MTRWLWCFAVIFSLTLPAFAEEILQRESANGSRNLRPFTVKDGWELRWDAKGDRFSASLYSPNGEPVDSLASQHKPGSGSSFYPKGGTYYLSVLCLAAIGPSQSCNFHRVSPLQL